MNDNITEGEFQEIIRKRSIGDSSFSQLLQ
jgi:hypothetical protein